MESLGLTRREVRRLVHDWIGVEAGYLGAFTYSSHDAFWSESCDLEISTASFDGTTRQCFEATLLGASADAQSKALRAVLDEYPPLPAPDASNPKLRSPELHQQILAWIRRLESATTTITVQVVPTTATVARALADADQLISTSGPLSAVDRVHTALHGYLTQLCQDWCDIPYERPTMNQLFKLLRASHPGFVDLGHRGSDVARLAGALATILDTLNPLRNEGSVAHPNEVLIGEAEALLVVNVGRSLLAYFDARSRRA